MSTYSLRNALDGMHPAIARYHLQELETYSALHNAIPFNIDMAGALKDVLEAIAREEATIRRGAMWCLEQGVKNQLSVIKAMVSFLQAKIVVSDDELLRTLCFLTSKEKLKALDKDALDSSEAIEIYDHLYKVYRSKQRASAAKISDLIKDLVRDVEEPKDRAVLYYHFTADTITPPLASKIDRLVKRCNVNVAKQVLHELPMSWKTAPGSPLGEVVALLRRSPNHQIEGTQVMDDDYKTELAWLVRLLGAHDAQTLLAAVDGARARLILLPRHAARNYATALKRMKGNDGDKKAKKINKAIYENSTGGKKGLSELVEDLEEACRIEDDDEDAPKEPRKIPSSLAKASVDEQIDIHNALIDFLRLRSYIVY
ncbi:hypothetical protein PG993_007904 [Apiospora rasikravindrae]|uniref:Uncharacterized protein n=1 Tax=Apiospora rasikravindrae TaxID=990691 RepID=A0ABR1SYT4_9PEZI